MRKKSVTKKYYALTYNLCQICYFFPLFSDFFFQVKPKSTQSQVNVKQAEKSSKSASPISWERKLQNTIEGVSQKNSISQGGVIGISESFWYPKNLNIRGITNFAQFFLSLSADKFRWRQLLKVVSNCPHL